MNITPALSFCITCKNRLYQIKNTLRKNLDDNVLHQDFIDFILVDFGSNDGLHDWVSDNFQPELASGYLKYYYTKELTRQHASIAKNTAHLCASGDILFMMIFCLKIYIYGANDQRATSDRAPRR